MPDLQRTFLAGKMNKDIDERLLPDGQYRHGLNVTIDTSSGSNVGSLQNGLGTTAVFPPVAMVANSLVGQGPTVTAIGAVAYEAKNLIYWFITSPGADAIIEYNEASSTMSRVLECTVAGGNYLNFDSSRIITGVNYLEGEDGDSYLFWTDNYNPPRRINITRCKSYGVNDPRIPLDINVILNPPMNAPYILLSNDTTIQTNNLEEKFLYFAYRYKYIDNEYSSISPFSSVAFIPGALNIDVETGDNKGMVNTMNKADITFETGNEFVTDIQLLVRDTRSLNVMIIENLNKVNMSIQNNSTWSFTFRNNKIYAPISKDQITRLFDNVPLRAQAQDMIGNRLIYGNYLQFRNISDCNDNGININFTVNYISSNLPTNPTTGLLIPKTTFRSDRDYEVGIIYGDDYGRMTTALTSTNSNVANNSSNAVYIPPINSSTANSLVVDIRNSPPCWATNYRFVIKQAKQNYYNIFPRGFFAQGAYRYFLLNESDRDKFSVGQYVIFKTGTNGPTHINKQFKILEFELKQALFLPLAPAGLYFKIKVDSTDTFLAATTIQNISTVNQGQNYGLTWSGSIPVLHNSWNNSTYNNPVNSYVSSPYFYGSYTSDQNAISTNFTNVFNIGSTVVNGYKAMYWGFNDLRYTIEVRANNKYNYTSDLTGQSGWQPNDIPIIAGAIDLIKLPIGISGVAPAPYSDLAFIIRWSSTSVSPGDKFKISCRSKNGENYFPGPSNNTGLLDNMSNQNGGFAVVNGNYNGPIYAGASITIQIVEDRHNSNAYLTAQTFTSQYDYKNIEEWFVESQEFFNFTQNNQAGVNVFSKGIWFRNTIGPGQSLPLTLASDQGLVNNYTSSPGSGQFTNFVLNSYIGLYTKMFIRGFGTTGGSNNSTTYNNSIKVSLNIDQVPTNKIVVCETVPSENDVDIFHELTRTYPIINHKHISRWQYNTKQSTFGGTRLTQTAKTQPHYFTVNDKIYINSVGIAPTTSYTITAIPSRYSIIINLPFPGGPTVPGGVSWNINDKDQTGVTNFARIQLNNPNYINSDYNAFCFGTGLESYRIKDDYANAIMGYSPRVTTIIEDYSEQNQFASLTYSGIFRGDSSINRLNEFNLSVANFMNLDKEYGPVRKLHARDSNLLVLHQDKVTSVLYGKNLLVDALGGGQVASIPEVLGNQIAYPGEYGISNNPESFAYNGTDIYFTDEKRGVVLKLAGDQISTISSDGMTDYFRDLMIDMTNKQKIGGYDPYNRAYVLSANQRLSLPCQLSLTPTQKSVGAAIGPTAIFLFAVTTPQPSWTIQLISTGFGTNWVSYSFPPGGYDQLIWGNVAPNNTGAVRSVIFEVYYCGGSKQFTLTQGSGTLIGVTNIVTS
tara:strand:+ start:2337 stop:6401 length:4065 start_codon:yes stop_codon:yes gene_type:complete